LVAEALLVNRVWPRNPINRNYRCLDADYSQPQEVEQPAGACLAFTRAEWTSIGGFDEGFFPVWFEDVDFCRRMLDNGGKIMYCPEAQFRHSGAHSVGQLSFRDRQLFWYGNMLRYARKHFPERQVRVLRGGIAAGMLLRSIGAVFGARKASLSETLASYWLVVKYAFAKPGS
jgi:GT2 family glycosyltransferase